MTSQPWIDRAGAAVLATNTVITAAIFVGFYTYLSGADFSLLFAILLALAGAVLGVVFQHFAWRRFGGREAVVLTQRWMRDGTVPETVPRDLWQPLLQRREELVVRDRWQLLTSLFWIAIAAFRLADDMHSDDALWALAIIFWLGAAAWAVYYNLRWLPVIRGLLNQRHAGGTTTLVASDRDSFS